MVTAFSLRNLQKKFRYFAIVVASAKITKGITNRFNTMMIIF